MWKKRFLLQNAAESPVKNSSVQLFDDETLRQHHVLPPSLYSMYQTEMPSSTHFEVATWPPMIYQVPPTQLQQFHKLDSSNNLMSQIQLHQLLYDIDIAKMQKMQELQQLEAMKVMMNRCNDPYQIVNLEQPNNVMRDSAYDKFIEQARDIGIDIKPVASRFDSKERASYMRANSCSFKAVLKNGELIKDDNGYLMVTHQTTTTINNNNVKEIQMSPWYPSNNSSDESPLNLCVRDLTPNAISIENRNLQPVNVFESKMKPTTFENKNVCTDTKNVQTVKIKNNAREEVLFPPIIKINLPNKSTADVKAGLDGKNVDRHKIKLTKSPKANALIQKVKPLLPVPAIKKTSTGLTVLWNFIVELLQDKTHEHVIRWASSKDFKFLIVNPDTLAKLWGQVKQNLSMDWKQVKKILDLYVKKKLLSNGKSRNEFVFLLVPKPCKDSLSVNKR